MQRVLILWAVCLGLGAFGLGPRGVAAHELNTSYTTLVLDESELSLSLTVDETDLQLLLPGLDRNGDGLLWADEVKAGNEEAMALLERVAELRADGGRLVLTALRTQIDTDGDGNLFARIHGRAPAPSGAARLELDLSRYLVPPLDSEHRNLLKIRFSGEPEALGVLSAASPVHEIRMAPGQQESLWVQVGRFTVLGVEHIFLGYDHILFLLALIVVGSRLGPLVKIVTAFTVAHSITLILAALEWVSLPSRLVESGIALSIAYVAAENFWLRRPDHRWILTFLFGFVHGFGFANVLRDLGLPSRGLVASLLAFNVGVELGQVAIVTVLFPLILWVAGRSFHARFVQVVSAVILLFGLGWLVERVFDLSYMPL